MNIKMVNAKILHSVKLDILYDDDTTSSYTLAQGDVATITYLENGNIVTTTGKITLIQYYDKSPYEKVIYDKQPGVEIHLDCSKENESSEAIIYSMSIKGINDTAEKYKEPEPAKNGGVEEMPINDGYDSGYDQAYVPSNPNNIGISTQQETDPNVQSSSVTNPSIKPADSY